MSIRSSIASVVVVSLWLTPFLARPSLVPLDSVEFRVISSSFFPPYPLDEIVDGRQLIVDVCFNSQGRQEVLVSGPQSMEELDRYILVTRDIHLLDFFHVRYQLLGIYSNAVVIVELRLFNLSEDIPFRVSASSLVF